MSVDLYSWRVGTANVKFVYIICVKRSVHSSTCLNYALTIFWVFLYVYLFILMSMITGPIVICATFFLNNVPYLNCLLSCLFTENKIVVSDSLTINFVILTLYTQTTVYFLKPLSNFIVNSVRKYATRLLTPSFVILRTSLNIKCVTCVCIIVIFCYMSSYLYQTDFYPGPRLVRLLLLVAGDVHRHPGPNHNSLKFCHWNLNSILTRDKIKISLIETYNSIFHYDIFAISDSLPNEAIENNDLFIEGFGKEIFRNDHPSGNKVGAVCLFFKQNIPIKRRQDPELIRETIVTEISPDGRKYSL